MAVTADGRRLTEVHRQAQVRLASLTALEMQTLWRLLDPEDLDSTAPGWLNNTVLLIRNGHTTSAALARRYYSDYRAAELGERTRSTLPTPGFSEEAVRTSLLVTGPFRLRHGISQGRQQLEMLRLGIAGSAAAGARHALRGGRETLLQAVSTDRRALGWARVTAAKPCAFCALLASQGPNYKTAATASFQAHDGCACIAEPVYSREAPWPGQAQEWSDLYASTARGTADPLTEFRRAYEGR